LRILITGIGGFVGKVLREALVKRGHEVFGIDIKSNGSNCFNVNLLSSADLDRCVAEVCPEVVIHLAAIANVDYNNVLSIYDVNLKGTINLVSSCVKLDNKPRFLFISSSQVYGAVDVSSLPIDESFPVNPVNHYGASKAAAETVISAFGKESGLEYTIARPFNHTGVNQEPSFVVPKIVAHFKERKSEISLGNIDTIRDISDVRDVAAAYILMVEKFTNRSIYNISSGNGIRIKDIVTAMQDISGHQIRIMQKDYLKRENDIGSVIGNSTKIRSLTGWKPAFSFTDTIRDMYFS
jgi:nucleoside-diphosphate-sugar epimerase